MTWETWQFAFNVTLPNLLMILLGVFLRRIRLFDDDFCYKASQFVFNVALPTLLFLSVAPQKISLTSNASLVLYGVISITIVYLLLEWVAYCFIKEKRDRGVFVQGGFRSNTAVVGLAYIANAYGNEGLAIGAVYMAVTVVLFNILAVITLTRSLHSEEKSPAFGKIIKNLYKNPLIIAISLGLIWSTSQLPIPAVIQQTGGLISSLALPLALLCVGVSLDFRAFTRLSFVAGGATFARLIIVPLMLTLGGWLCGFRGTTLGVIFLFAATPTASASYVMTRAMGGNATLAANIIAMTSIGSFFTSSIGLYLLKSWGII